MALPDTYKQVEYIESSGTQYIDTGVNANQYLSYEADFQATTTTGSTTNTTLFGARTASGTNRFGLMIYNSTFHMMIGNTSAFNTTVDTKRHKCSVFMNNGAFTSNIDGTEETGSPGTSVYVNQNFLLFKINYGSDGALPYRLYSFKLYTGNSTLVRDFIPCYRIIDGVAGLYDLVNDVFYTNQGTGVFIQGPDKDKKIPSTYKQVEYIESNPTNPGDSTGTYQYINTGYNPTLNTEISIDIQLTNTANQSTLFGETTSNTSYLSFISYVNSSNHWARYMRNGNSGNPTDTGVTVDTNRHTFVVNKTTYKIYTDGVQVYSGTNTNSPTTNGNIPLYLFANNNGGNPNIVSAAKIYSCKIWDNGTLYRDMVPVIRNSDNKPGMYDIVTDTFYTNAGTGEFNYKKYPESGQIQHIYLAQNLIYPPQPSEITIEYTNLPVGTAVNAQKDGYKVKQVIFYGEGYYSGSEWKNGGMNLYDDVTTRTNIHVNIQLGGTWGYDYGNWGAYNGYGVERTNQTAQAIIKGNSGCANSHNFYVKFTTNKDTTEYKFGTSSSNITQSGTATHSATVQQWITDLFNGTNLKVSRNAWGNEDWFTVGYKITVVYESV